MKILLTGGTGFLGKTYIESNKEHSIFATYRKDHPENKKNIKWIKLDLLNKNDFKTATDILKKEKIEIILHIGGATPNRAYSEKSFAATTEGTKNIIELGKKLGIKKIIFISSLTVIFPHKGPYADSKREAEKIIMGSKIPYTIFRPETIIGEHALDFNRVAKIAIKSKFFPVLGMGNNKTQPIAVKDLISMIEISMKNRKTDFKTYIAVGKEALTLREFIREIAKTNKNKILFIHIPIFLAKIFAKIASIVYPKLGINMERIFILSFSREYTLEHMKDFQMELTSFRDMISFLKRNKSM